MSDSYWMVERDVKAIAEHSPFIGEQLTVDLAKIAVELGNADRGAEAGLRALQSRPFLGRILDSFTGKGQRLQAAIGSDLLAAQKATLGLVGVLMRNQAITENCQERVLEYLCELKVEVVPSIMAELKQQRRDIDRAKALRRLDRRFDAGILHRGSGSIFGAALYVAQVRRLFASAPFEELWEESKLALDVATRKFGDDPEPLAALLLRSAAEIEPNAIEGVAYLSSRESGPALKALDVLMSHRIKGRKLSTALAERSAATAREETGEASNSRENLGWRWYMNENRWPVYMRERNPHKILVEQFADELLRDPSGDSE